MSVICNNQVVKVINSNDQVHVVTAGVQGPPGPTYVFPGGFSSVWIPASSMTPLTTDGADDLIFTEVGARQPELKSLPFPPALDRYADFDVSFPNRWDGLDLRFYIFWTGLVAGAGDVTWSIQAFARGDGDSLDMTPIATTTVTDTFQSVTTQHISFMFDVTPDGSPEDGDNVFCVIAREGASVSDTRNAYANLLGVKVLYNTTALAD